MKPRSNECRPQSSFLGVLFVAAMLVAFTYVVGRGLTVWATKLGIE